MIEGVGLVIRGAGSARGLLALALCTDFSSAGAAVDDDEMLLTGNTLNVGTAEDADEESILDDNEALETLGRLDAVSFITFRSSGMIFCRVYGRSLSMRLLGRRLEERLLCISSFPSENRFTIGALEEEKVLEGEGRRLADDDEEEEKLEEEKEEDEEDGVFSAEDRNEAEGRIREDRGIEDRERVEDTLWEDSAEVEDVEEEEEDEEEVLDDDEELFRNCSMRPARSLSYCSSVGNACCISVMTFAGNGSRWLTIRSTACCKRSRTSWSSRYSAVASLPLCDPGCWYRAERMIPRRKNRLASSCGVAMCRPVSVVRLRSSRSRASSSASISC